MISVRTLISSRSLAYLILALAWGLTSSTTSHAQEADAAEKQSTPTDDAAEDDATTDDATTTDTETLTQDDDATTETVTQAPDETATEATTDTEAAFETVPAQLSPVLIEGRQSPRLAPVLRPRLAPVLKQDSPRPAKDSPEHRRLWEAELPATRPGSGSAVPPARPSEQPQSSGSARTQQRPDRSKQPPLRPPTPMTAQGNRGPAAKANPILERRMVEGRRMLSRGSLASARKIFLQIAKQAPQSSEAPEALFYAATAQDDLTLVRNELREVVRKHPRSKATRRALSRIGEICLILGDYEESLSAFRALRRVSDRPDQRREASSKIILALVRSGSFEEAAVEIEKAVARHPDLKRAPEIIDAHGEALLGAGRYAEGSALLADAETQFPNYEFAAKVLLNRGLCEELNGNPAEASEIYRAVRSRFPDGIESSLASARLRDIANPLNASPRGAVSPEPHTQ